jgi:hypothetical protein
MDPFAELTDDQLNAAIVALLSRPTHPRTIAFVDKDTCRTLALHLAEYHRRRGEEDEAEEFEEDARAM